jgi:putative ATP-dependent endonuclease of OLD family
MTRTKKQSTEAAVREIRRKTRRKFAPEEKVRIVLEGLRGEQSISELCRREGIASNLSYKLSQLNDAICNTHVFLDFDQSAKDISDRASQEGNLVPAQLNFATCQGMAESEIEDMYDSDLYSEMIAKFYGVNLDSAKFKSAKKWSERMAECFHEQGRKWDKRVSADAKMRVAELVESDPANALNEHKRSAFDSLVAVLDERVSGK